MHRARAEHAAREGPWDDIGAFSLEQSVSSCLPAGLCVEQIVAGPGRLSPNRLLRKKGSDSIPSSGLSWALVFLPNTSHKLSLREAYPCFADRNRSVTELINKPKVPYKRTGILACLFCPLPNHRCGFVIENGGAW